MEDAADQKAGRTGPPEGEDPRALDRRPGPYGRLDQAASSGCVLPLLQESLPWDMEVWRPGDRITGLAEEARADQPRAFG